MSGGTITTESETSSLIATDRGGGTVTVDGGKYTAKGKKSAICYSTGDITVTGIAGSSALGPMCVVEGSNKITVNLDEYESVRLLDYKGLQQTEAAEAMRISRPTLTRIYAEARRKIASAIVEGRPSQYHFLLAAGCDGGTHYLH